jgi:hypothetical protein
MNLLPLRTPSGEQAIREQILPLKDRQHYDPTILLREGSHAAGGWRTRTQVDQATGGVSDVSSFYTGRILPQNEHLGAMVR